MSDDQTLLQNLPNLPLSEIANRRGSPIDGGVHAYLDAELARRVAQAQIDSAAAQKQAVENAKWSVFWLAGMAGLSALFQMLGWLFPNPLSH